MHYQYLRPLYLISAETGDVYKPSQLLYLNREFSVNYKKLLLRCTLQTPLTQRSATALKRAISLLKTQGAQL